MELIQMIKEYAELLAYFKAAVVLAIVLGTGCGAFWAMWRHAEKDNEKLLEINQELHAKADDLEAGFDVLKNENDRLATLAEERKNNV